MSTTDRFFENIKTKAKVLGLGMLMFFSGQNAAAQTAHSKDKAPTQKHTLAYQKSLLTIHGVKLSMDKIQPADITHAFNTSKALQNKERSKQWNRLSSRFAALEKAGFWHVSQSDYASQDKLFGYKTFVTTTAGYPLGKVIKMLEQAKKETGANDAAKISSKVYDLLITQSSKYKRRFIEEKNSIQTVMNYIKQNGSTKVLAPVTKQQEVRQTKKADSETKNFVHISAANAQPKTGALQSRNIKVPPQLFQNDKMSDHIATDSANMLQDLTASFATTTNQADLDASRQALARIITTQTTKKADNIPQHKIPGLVLDDDLQAQMDADLSKIKTGGTYHGNIKVNFFDMKTSSSFAWVWEAWNKPSAYNDGSHGGGKSIGLFQFNLANTMRTFMKKYGKKHPKLNDVYTKEGYSSNFRHEWAGIHGEFEKDPVKKAKMFEQAINEQDEHMWSQYDGPFAYFAKKYSNVFPLITEKNHNNLETMTLVASVKMAINQGPNRIYKIVSLGVTEAKKKYGNNPTSHQLAHEISLARIKVWPKYENRYKDETKMLDDFEACRTESQKIIAQYQSLQHGRNLLAQNNTSNDKLLAEASSTRVSQIQSDTIHLRKYPKKTVTMRQLLAQSKLKQKLIELA